jgi:hypothetical protein
MPVILAAQEAETRRIAVPYSLRNPTSKKPITKKGWWSDLRYRP